ncbi:MAG: S8 family peptidase [bacterium]
MDRFVIGFESGALGTIIRHLEVANGQITLIDTAARFIVIHFPNQIGPDWLKQNISGLAGVRFIEPELPIRALFTPNDPMFLTKQWDKWVMYADLAWDVITRGEVRVVVIDNGVEYTHPDLAPNFRDTEPGYDFVNNDNDPAPDNPGIENAFHGTHVAGIIAAATDNLIGIAGWAQVQLLAARVLNDSGNGTQTDVARGIRWAADQNVKVINMSLGGDQASTPLIEACQYAVQKGVLLIAASGNDGRAGITYPARMNECVAVGATDELSGLAYFSNYGPEQELVAPGTAIYSTSTGNTFVEANGTSMSCPQVSGIAALLFALNPSFTANRVRAILGASAIDMGALGRDEYFGFGLLNAYRAVQLAQDLSRNTTPHFAKTTLSATIIARQRLFLPDLKGSVSVYDPAGRLKIKTTISSAPVILPGPGTYFLKVETECSSFQMLKVLIPD